ncbi:MAG TPA: hypothetical protein VLA34_07365 [Candidatus Krumholzibacterium sp.]|nr:hypothetical protein [Candidatus Krumholzibacterium sp.]
MVGKHLESIREREARASARLDEARAEGAGIIDRASEEGAKLLEDRRIEGSELMRRKIAEARENARGRIETLRAGGEELTAKLDKSADARRDDAVEMIMDSFRGGSR